MRFSDMVLSYLFSASCRSQQESQKNLFFWQSISLAENCRRQAVTLEFCSISMERSRKDSSREETYWVLSTAMRRCVSHTHGLTRQTTRLAGQGALEELVNEGGLLRCSRVC